MKLKIFISSVQKEFAEERKLLKRYISKNPAYRRLFDTFVFEEDVVAADRRTDEVYLDELQWCDVYIGLIGNEYGFEDSEGVSPTEREYDEATRLGLTRLVFVLEKNGSGRHPKETAFLKKISSSVIRAKCEDPSALLLEIYASLDGLLVEQGAYRMGPFDASPCEGATLDDIAEEKVKWFTDRARHLRNASLDEAMSIVNVLRHLKLVGKDAQDISNAALLLFGSDPQRFYVSSEVKCAQWYGVERHKPMLSYQIYKGTLFDMADAAIAFVLSKLDLRVGTRNSGPEAPREYEIPEFVVSEAIINAIAHRDYTSSGSVQVEVFSDRLVIRNPGRINPAIKKEDLFTDHPSCPNNALIADQLYQVKYIEKFGTGFTDLLDGCKSAGLPVPDVIDDGAWFTLTIWRKVGKGSQKSSQKGSQKSSQKILDALRQDPNISTMELAEQIGISRRAVAKHIAALQASGALRRIGPDKGGHWEVVCE